MGRVQAEDHHLKREAILGQAARLFADGGFAGTSMNAIAAACGVSKALLYHYYPSKEAILDDILVSHLDRLITATEGVAARPLPPAERLEALSIALLEAYRDADAHHRVQLNDLERLPPDRQEALRGMERRLVRVFAAALADVHPHLAGRPELLKPLTMSLFGMLNWQYLWFREDGPLSRDDYGRLATRLVVAGAPGADAALPGGSRPAPAGAGRPRAGRGTHGGNGAADGDAAHRPGKTRRAEERCG